MASIVQGNEIGTILCASCVGTIRWGFFGFAFSNKNCEVHSVQSTVIEKFQLKN